MTEINTQKRIISNDILMVKTAQTFHMPLEIADPLYACGKILKEMKSDRSDYKMKQWHQIQSLAKLIEEILITLEINGLPDKDKYILDNILETAEFLCDDLIFPAVLENPTKRLKEWMDEETKMRENSGEVKTYVYNNQRV